MDEQGSTNETRMRISVKEDSSTTEPITNDVHILIGITTGILIFMIIVSFLIAKKIFHYFDRERI
jgi:hypothetical protein